MSGIGRGTRGIDTKLLYSLDEGQKTASSFTLEVGDITSIGELSDSASTSEVSVYGQGYTNTFTTVKNVGQLELEFLANSDDSGQVALESLYESQDTASFDIRLIQGNRQTDYMFDGQVSKFSVNPSADDIVRYSVSLVVHGKVTKENKAEA